MYFEQLLCESAEFLCQGTRLNFSRVSAPVKWCRIAPPERWYRSEQRYLKGTKHILLVPSCRKKQDVSGRRHRLSLVWFALNKKGDVFHTASVSVSVLNLKLNPKLPSGLQTPNSKLTLVPIMFRLKRTSFIHSQILRLLVSEFC